MLLRTLLLAFAVILAPQATVAHAALGDGEAVMHAPNTVHAHVSHAEVPADEVTECCEAAAQQMANCGGDLVAIADAQAAIDGQSTTGSNRMLLQLGSGVCPETLLDPPRR